MDTIFLSFSFREPDQALVRPIVQMIEVVLGSHEMRAITGEYLGGGPLTDEIRRRIKESSGFIGVLTQDISKPNGKFTPHAYVRDELLYARSIKKPALALVQHTIELDGMLLEHEYASFGHDADLVHPILKVTTAVGTWRRTAGKPMKVQIKPEKVGLQAAQEPEHTVCEYRVVRNGNPDPWSQTGVVGEIGGTFIYVPRTQPDDLLEVRVKAASDIWQSKAAPQYLNALLVKKVKK